MPRSSTPLARSATERSRGSTATTHGIQVDVVPSYLPAHSVVNPAPGENPRYAFSYRIRISNLGDATVQLLTRRWIIVDADGERHEVVGEGVVGQQPRLDPGAVFEYESFCPLPTPWGTMEGAYGMEVQSGRDRGRTIDARIERFYLASPGV